MDNSVYQPLSHALQPPASRTPYPQDGHAQQLQQQQQQVDNDHDSDQDAHGEVTARPEEEEEEEEEEVEGAVDHPTSTGADAQTSANHSHSDSTPARRRPGRPKGSKNKKPRYDLSGSPPNQPFAAAPFYGFPPLPQPNAVPAQPHPPPHPVSVTLPYPAPDKAFQDFHWRVLVLCTEFYNAADELIRSAPQHILDQCFSSPGNQVDALAIINDARRACDQLMANPSQIALKPTLGSFPPPAASNKDGPPPTASSAAVITNPGSFVISLSNTGSQSYSSAAGFQPQTRYPTTPYYSYATQPNQSGAHPYMAQQQVMKPVNLSTPSAAGNQGAWSDEETDKLKRLTEESKMAGTGTESGEIDWDWVCSAWGSGRTRHQILIKATNMGLKESSTRGMKRRRETDPGPGGVEEVPSSHAGANGNASPSTQAVLNAVGAAAAASSGSSSVSSDRPTSTSLSPIATQQQAPPPPPAPPGGGNLMHWPMPHIAANTPPVISGNPQGSRSVYYNRDRTAKS